MTGDALNTTRAVSLRLSIAFAATTMLAFFIFLAGNLGDLSDTALLVAVRALGGAGIITVMFGCACVVFSLLSRLGGARLPVISIIIGVMMTSVGFAGAVVSASLQVVTGGMSL
jgi:hypothetical protein